MTIREKLTQDITVAMKSRDKERLIVLRSLNSDIKNFEINNRDKAEATDEDIAQILAKGIKSRQESLQQYEMANRQDLAEKEAFEIDIYRLYQPAQLSEDELRAIILTAITDSNAQSSQDMGKVMGRIQPLVKGKADGKMVNDLVRTLLAPAS